MGSFPHELPGYRHVSDDAVRGIFEAVWGRADRARARAAHPQHVRRRDRRHVPRHVRPGRGHRPVRPEHHAREGRARRRSTCSSSRTSSSTRPPKFAHVFLPGTSFLEKDGTFTNAERRINRVRPVMAPARGKQEWEVACELATAMGYPMHYDDASADHGRDRQRPRRPSPASRSTTSTSSGSMQWPCNDAAPDGTPIMHVGRLRARQGPLRRDAVRADGRADEPQVPADPDDRPHPVPVQRRRADPAYGERRAGTSEDVLEIHPHDAEDAGHRDGDWVALTSRVGETTHARQGRPTGCRRVSSTRRSTTPVSGANVVTTEYSDWATNCPEYKVTAVQVAVTTAPDRVTVG